MLVPQTRTEKGIIILIIHFWCRRHLQTRTHLDGSWATHTSQVNLTAPIAAGTFHVFLLLSIIFQNVPTEETGTDLPMLFLICTMISSLSLLQAMMVVSFYLQCLQCFPFPSLASCLSVCSPSFLQTYSLHLLKYHSFETFVRIYIHPHPVEFGVVFESPSNNQLNQIPNTLATLRVSLMCSSPLWHLLMQASCSSNSVGIGWSLHNYL